MVEYKINSDSQIFLPANNTLYKEGKHYDHRIQ